MFSRRIDFARKSVMASLIYGPGTVPCLHLSTFLLLLLNVSDTLQEFIKLNAMFVNEYATTGSCKICRQ